MHIQDPIYGFVCFPVGVLQQLLNHAYVQRLRHISQLGVSERVYPSATHTRFQHALGTFYLMQELLAQLQKQGTRIEREEKEAALIAALLHDIGHGPMSHTLEQVFLNHSHEHIGLLIIDQLEGALSLDLSLSRRMLTGIYDRPFFCELLSGPLDVDRMDYLHRDSFFTGVSEGHINVNRLLKVLYVEDDHIKVLAKGKSTVEDFFHARSMMYRQVYHHKTVLAASCMLRSTFQRAFDLAQQGAKISAPDPLESILYQRASKEALLLNFLELQDAHIWISLQSWSKSEDRVLSLLSKGLLHRVLWATEIGDTNFSDNFTYSLALRIQKKLNLQSQEATYLVCQGNIEEETTQQSLVYMNRNPLSTALSTRYYICYPKSLTTPSTPSE